VEDKLINATDSGKTYILMYELLSYSAIKKSIATSKLLIFKFAI